MRFSHGVLLSCDPALKVYLTEKKRVYKDLYGEDVVERSLDEEHFFIFNKNESIVGNLQQVVDSWIKEHTYEEALEEDDELD